MQHRYHFFSLLYLFLTSFSIFANNTVIHNINGYTPTKEGNLHRFSTLVIRNGKVVKTGGAELVNSRNKDTLIDGQGKTLLPGLIDAHGHLLGLAENLTSLDLRGSKNIEEIGKKLQAFAKTTSSPLLVGRGWDQTLWPSKTFPTAKDLDAFINDRPVVLTRVDGHAIWVNTKALSIAKVNSGTQSPEGGEIIKTLSGEPSGIFIDKAEQLVLAHMPKIESNPISLLPIAANHLLSLGITSAHDAGIDYQTWLAYKSLVQSHQLPVRVYAMLNANDPRLEAMLKAGIYRDTKDYLSIRSVKVYADGALGSRGAALLSDYHDRPNYKGLMLENQKQLKDILDKVIKSGFSAHTHAIGDRANKLVLDAYEDTFKRIGGRLLRNRIEHAQVVDVEDIQRFKGLNIIPSMQPIHATSDMHMAEERLSEQQLSGAYAWLSFLEQGSRVAAGSDFPVELANPFYGLHAAVTRQNRLNQPKKGWRPEQKLSRFQALNAFTLDAAYAAFQEYKIGSLEQGKWADFIVIDEDYFTIPEEKIDDIKVQQTWIAGELVFSQ